ncbi:MAG: D-aminoacylase [Gemmatimonadota bacterium]|nr:D-aminoacylase [Gemmatimonadota bacterium]
MPTHARSLTLLFLAALAFVSPARGQSAAYDVIITGGRIVDGTGNGWYPGDVGIRGDRIVAITPRGMLDGAEAGTRIDATGKVVAPGFIDIQSHSRFAFLGDGDGRVVSKVTMGVTTEIMGESTTNAPVRESQAREGTAFAGPRAFDEWIQAMTDHGASVNFGSFVGATTIRVLGKGQAMGAANETQLEMMRMAVRNAMEDGAFGIGSALIYPPGNFASTDELVEINRAAAPYGGVYITHMRSEADQFLEAIDEAIEIGTRAGVPVEIYHLKAGGTLNWHKAAEAVAKIDSARAAGVDIQANMYPYTAGGTGLTACFPPWASADGKLFDNLADPGMRARIRSEIEHQTSDWENLCSLATPEGVLLLGFDKRENRRYMGRRLSEVAAELGKDWIETAFDLVLDERQRIGTIYFMMSEENVAMQIGQPWIKFGTDAGGIDPERAGGLSHPRAYGTFTRVLGKYVREEGATTLEEAVRKMSSAVATRLHIRDRGLLKEGFFADVVVFDPETVGDRATYEEPHQVSVGMEHVLVNGVPVVSHGRHTGALPGRAVRGPGWAGWER